jgi:hypothetical protein
LCAAREAKLTDPVEENLAKKFGQENLAKKTCAPILLVCEIASYMRVRYAL